MLVNHVPTIITVERLFFFLFYFFHGYIIFNYFLNAIPFYSPAGSYSCTFLFLFLQQGGETEEFVAVLGSLHEIETLGSLLHLTTSVFDGLA